jgi:hypothetical protein
MIGAAMTVPRDVLRFEILLYLSLLLDTLSAAFFGLAPDRVSLAEHPSASLFTAFFTGALVLLVWLAVRRQKNWARWTLFGLFVLSVVLYIGAFGEMTFSLGSVFDLVSFVLSALGFYFGFTAEARNWFKS